MKVMPRRENLSGPKRPDLMPILVLGGLIILGIASWWLIPAFMHLMKHQSCIGSGRMDC